VGEKIGISPSNWQAFIGKKKKIGTMYRSKRKREWYFLQKFPTVDFPFLSVLPYSPSAWFKPWKERLWLPGLKEGDGANWRE